ncbi:MAG: ATP-binding cassette domain-containing protein [Dermatophilaceae bacterium]
MIYEDLATREGDRGENERGEIDVRAVDALAIDDVTHRFGHHVAVDHLSLTVRPGECFGLLGPNGAGKTTTIRLLNTLLPVQTGRIRVFGVDVRAHPMAVRRMLGYVPQQLSVESALTGRENVMWFARLFDVPRAERRERVDDVLGMMDLLDDADKLVGAYSGGMVRRLELAQALVNRPALLVLDEPTVGLDPIARESVWQRVVEMQGEQEMTVILTTHYMEEADALCDRVVLMDHGCLKAVGTPAELKARIGPEATLEDVFRRYSDAALADHEKGGLRNVRTTRRTAGRLG